jgi:hypothetical protein
MKFLVSGANPKKNYFKEKEGFKYKEAFLILLDWERKKNQKVILYKSPEIHREKSATHMFKTGTLLGTTLIVPTCTEILFIDIKNFLIQKTISLPSFNDLHHVNILKDYLYIANTGAECIQVVNFEGRLLNEYPMAKNPTWKSFKEGTDLRFVGPTKPHETHINHVFFINEVPWVTRFQQRDAIALHDPSKKINLSFGNGKPHDGLVKGDFIYFTLTDGHIVIINKKTLKDEDIINLNSISENNLQLGWCRGIEVIDNNAFVGFSRIRKSKFRDYGSWILHGKKKLPARISQYDIIGKKLINEVKIQSKGAAIFTIRQYPF